MSATTLASFYSTYSALSISGATSISYPPTTADLNTGKLPLKWVDSCGIDTEGLRAKGTGGTRTLRCRLIVAVSRQGQSTHDSRWADTLAMVDTVNAAIKGAGNSLTRWTVAAEPNLDGISGFFAVVADIEQREFVV